MFSYKGYKLEIRANLNNNVLSGRLLRVRSSPTFEGADLQEIKERFYDVVDMYLRRCEVEGKKPEKPFSGKFLLRTDPDTHRRIFFAAAQNNQSINSWLETLVKENVEKNDEIFLENLLVGSDG